jgi:hypothetical protein
MDVLPESYRQELVMSDSVIDGQSVRTWRFSSDQTPQALLEAAQAHFRETGRRVIAVTRGDWRIVSALGAQDIHTVQIRSGPRGAEGLSSVWVRPDARASTPSRMPWAQSAIDELQDWLPASLQVHRRIAHHDTGRWAATLVASGPIAAAELASRLLDRARRAGYEPDPALGLPAQGAAWYRGDRSRTPGDALALRRRSDEVIATLASQGELTSVVIHWSRAR